MKELSVNVVLPTYNEKENIGKLIDEIHKYLSEWNHKIIIVDDNSPDGTAKFVEENYSNSDYVKLILRTKNKGLAFSIRDGIQATESDIIIVMDTDFNHKPEDLPKMLHIIESFDMVIGTRFIYGGWMYSRPRYYLSYIYNIMMRLLLGTRLDDNLSGFFAIRSELMKQLDFDKIFWGYGDYYFRLLLFAQKKKYSIIQMPVVYGARYAGVSKTRFLQVFTQYTSEVIKLGFITLTKKDYWRV